MPNHKKLNPKLEKLFLFNISINVINVATSILLYIYDVFTYNYYLPLNLLLLPGLFYLLALFLSIKKSPFAFMLEAAIAVTELASNFRFNFYGLEHDPLLLTKAFFAIALLIDFSFITLPICYLVLRSKEKKNGDI